MEQKNTINILIFVVIILIILNCCLLFSKKQQIEIVKERFTDTNTLNIEEIKLHNGHNNNTWYPIIIHKGTHNYKNNGPIEFSIMRTTHQDSKGSSDNTKDGKIYEEAKFSGQLAFHYRGTEQAWGNHWDYAVMDFFSDNQSKKNNNKFVAEVNNSTRHCIIVWLLGDTNYTFSSKTASIYKNKTHIPNYDDSGYFGHTLEEYTYHVYKDSQAKVKPKTEPHEAFKNNGIIIRDRYKLFNSTVYNEGITNAVENMGRLANFISSDGSNFNIPGNLVINGDTTVNGKSTFNNQVDIKNGLGLENSQGPMYTHFNYANEGKNYIRGTLFQKDILINKDFKGDASGFDRENYIYFRIKCVGLREGCDNNTCHNHNKYLYRSNWMMNSTNHYIQYGNLNIYSDRYIFRLDKNYKTTDAAYLYSKYDNGFGKTWIHNHNSWMISKNTTGDDWGSIIIKKNSKHSDVDTLKENTEYVIQNINKNEFLGVENFNGNNKTVAGVSPDSAKNQQFKFVFEFV